jgi:hypothetical protein
MGHGFHSHVKLPVRVDGFRISKAPMLIRKPTTNQFRPDFAVTESPGTTNKMLMISSYFPHEFQDTKPSST